MKNYEFIEKFEICPYCGNKNKIIKTAPTWLGDYYLACECVTNYYTNYRIWFDQKQITAYELCIPDQLLIFKSYNYKNNSRSIINFIDSSKSNIYLYKYYPIEKVDFDELKENLKNLLALNSFI